MSVNYSLNLSLVDVAATVANVDETSINDDGLERTRRWDRTMVKFLWVVFD